MAKSKTEDPTSQITSLLKEVFSRIRRNHRLLIYDLRRVPGSKKQTDW